METFKKTFVIALFLLSVGIAIFASNAVYQAEWKKEVVKKCTRQTGFLRIPAGIQYEKELERCFNENGLK